MKSRKRGRWSRLERKQQAEPVVKEKPKKPAKKAPAKKASPKS